MKLCGQLQKSVRERREIETFKTKEGIVRSGAAAERRKKWQQVMYGDEGRKKGKRRGEKIEE